MKKLKISMVILMPLLLLATLTLVATVYASSSQPASGETTQVCTGTAIDKVAGGNTFLSTNCVRTFTGTLEGTITSVVKITLHCAPFPCIGKWNIDSSGTFVGTVAGSDSGTALYSATITGVRPEFEEHVALEGRTGGLANVHASLVRVGIGGASASYSGGYHFEP